jgi:hypothetical protein
MPLDVPNLDDRRWTDLMAEARALIPQIAPAWTDHNAHDPGITFIELFAWLAEMQIYQLNRVGDRHREAFGRLAGVRRGLRRPARVDLQVADALSASVVVPAGARVTLVDDDELAFETEIAVPLTRSRLRRVVVDDGAAPVDQTQANGTRGVLFLAFGADARAGASLRLGFDAFYPDKEPQLRLAADVVTDDLSTPCEREADGVALAETEAETGAAAASPVDLVWEYLGPGEAWSALTVIDDGTGGFRHSGAVTLATPANAARRDEQVWIRCRIARGQYDLEPRLRRIGVNVLPCLQQETVRDELLGTGSGRPDQEFALHKGPVLIPGSERADAQPLVLQVNDVEWQRVESFDASAPDSTHFVFDVDRGRVLFGNGLNGRVPMPAQRVVAVQYQTSRGAGGGVAQDQRWAFRDGSVTGVTLINPSPASGGADPEPLDALELRARAQLRRAQRGVTLADLERLARATPQAYVARAKAIANCPAPERITIVAQPKARPGRQGAPRKASDAFLAAVQQQLQRHRLLGDDLRVVGPLYIEVRVTARLRLVRRADPAAVIARAREALDRFLAGELQPSDRRDASGKLPAAASASPSPCPTRWPFGRSVFPSEIYAVLDDVAGVDSAAGVVLRAWNGATAIQPLEPSRAIPVPPTGLVFAGPHDLTIDETDARRRR